MADDSTSGGPPPPTVVLFPFMAQGHLNPFLDLARLLAVRSPSLSITIVSTPATTLSLRPRFLRHHPSVHFADLSVHLPSHSTDALSTPAAVSHFYRTSHSLLSGPFLRLLRSLPCPPTCVVSDMFLAFAVDAAHTVGSKHVTLYTSGPFAMSIYNSIWSYFPHKKKNMDDDDDADVIIRLPGLPDSITVERSQISENMNRADPDDPSCWFARKQAELNRGSDGSLWNTVEVLEKSSLEYWAENSFDGEPKPVWAIGPLLPLSEKEYERGGKVPGMSPAEIIEWLDQKPQKSTIYVSFGSQNSIPRPQMRELARGLELSNQPFIWVLRNPTGINIEDQFQSEWLPEGFVERIRETQPDYWFEIGLPRLRSWWPLGSEQFYNAKLLVEELGACMEVARGFDAAVNGEELAGKVGWRAEERRRVERLSVRDGVKGSSLRALDEFLGILPTWNDERRVERLSVEMRRAVEEVDGVKGSSLRALDEFLGILPTWNDEVSPCG
ncbi:hypothetical protein Syun_026135 [Stephania yunnanensis]|uniref:Glycosyltransferase N-terminal domain-containing protein n=1 Tax=Stephania yunnanensis TaxID=152371 RepID=A0AAP0HWR6_9MAGN